MKKILLSTIMIIFLLVTTTITLIAGTSRPHLLILHSYNTDYAWTNELNLGIDKIKEKHLNHDIRYHYMNTKNQSGEDALRRSAIAAKRAIDSYKPDVLIAFDDDAQRLVAMHYINHPDMQIVFAGINADIERYGYHEANNVTGILERKSVPALKEVWSLLVGEKKDSPATPYKTLFLSDSSSSAMHDADYLQLQDWSPIEYTGHIAVNNFTEWKNAVEKNQNEYDFLLVGGYRKLSADNTNQFVSPKTVAQWTEAHSSIPIIGINSFNSEDGFMLSIGVSAYEQGEIAFSRAITLLDDPTAIKNMPILTSQQYIVALREDALIKREIVVPKILETFARSTNHYFE